VVTIKVKKLHPDARLPSFGTAGAAGADLFAVLDCNYPLGPGETARIPLGFACEIPPGYEIQVRPRSGLAARYAVTVTNSPGTVDCDFRGEMMVLLINHGPTTIYIAPGDRVAQAVVNAVPKVEYVLVDELGDTGRGAGGFGSTGGFATHAAGCPHKAGCLTSEECATMTRLGADRR
jgi:dUTP pyrophosphatase